MEGGGGEASFEKAEFGSRCIFNRIRTHELEAENSQPASLNSRPAGRPGSPAMAGERGGREQEHLGFCQGRRGWRRRCGRPFSPTLSLSLSAASERPSVPRWDAFMHPVCRDGVGSPDPVWLGPSWSALCRGRSSSGGRLCLLPPPVGMWVQPASKVYSDVALSLGFGGEGWQERIRASWNDFLPLNMDPYVLRGDLSSWTRRSF